jgi:chromosome segregation protein
MHGFKSFAEPVSIEFNDGITCIVGPNGSGKSKISDAIRWALGEQSPKTLRGGKMEEVIFAGTASRKSRGMAEVTLVIDNSTNILPIDYSEVAITRRMYRSGESEYSINNVSCRLKDIRELIMDTGIGVDGYSLIGQGKIADIVSNKPESRREIFEEAAGIVMYRTKKADSEKKLEAAASNLERVNDIVAEIESRIGGLAEDSKKAKEYLDLRERYKALEINITLKNIESVELKNEYINDDIAESENGVAEIKEEKLNTDKSVAEARQSAETLDKLVNETRDKLLICIEDINAITNRNQLSREKLAQAEKEEARLTLEMSSYAEKLLREEKNSEELLKAKDEIDKRLTALKDELTRRTKEYAMTVNESAELGNQIDGRKNELFRLHNDISVKNSEIKSLEGLKGTLDRRGKEIMREKDGARLVEKDLKGSLDKAAL